MLLQDRNIRDIEVKFVGFVPNEEVNAEIKALTDELYMRAPSDSYLKTTFTIQNGAVKGLAQLISINGRFEAVAEDVDVHALAKKLMYRMKRKLDDWRSHRILGVEDLTGNMLEGPAKQKLAANKEAFQSKM